MDYFTPLELPLTIIAGIANLTLAGIVYVHETKNASNRIFSLLALTMTFWGLANYFSLNPFYADTDFYIKLVMCLAVPQGVLFYLFINNFPERKLIIRQDKLVAITLVTVLMMILTMTNSVFSHVYFKNGRVVPAPGWGMPLFAIFTIGFILAGIDKLIKKYKQVKTILKKQWQLIAGGFILMFLLIVVFDFILVNIFQITAFVAFSPLFTLPFVLLSTYAIIKHRLLNIKIISTEVLVGLILIILFAQTFFYSTWVELLIKIISLGGASILSFMMIKSVIKEVKIREVLEQANKKLKQLDKAKTEFISITSHELRTPLTGLQGYLSMLLEGDFGELGLEKRKVIGQLYSSTNRLGRLVNMFLNVSRIELGRLVLNKSQVQLEKLVQSSIQELKPEADKKGLKLEFNLPAHPAPMLNIDQDKIKDVILNLVANAIKYTKEGLVKVWIEDKQNYIEFHVKDTGMGFTESERQNFFKKFSRGRSTKMGIEGSGLGLFIAKSIIEAHQGKIWCNSAGANQGSTFSFSLPIK